MEDIKIHRKTARRSIANDINPAANDDVAIPGNPDRIALIILPLSEDIGFFSLRFDPDPAKGIFFYGSSCIMGTYAIEGTSGVVIVNETATRPYNQSYVFHIKDYGQIILGDIYIHQYVADGSFSVSETYLDARESRDL
jgi:hypothetical protein